MIGDPKDSTAGVARRHRQLYRPLSLENLLTGKEAQTRQYLGRPVDEGGVAHQTTGLEQEERKEYRARVLNCVFAVLSAPADECGRPDDDREEEG